MGSMHSTVGDSGRFRVPEEGAAASKGMENENMCIFVPAPFETAPKRPLLRNAGHLLKTHDSRLKRDFRRGR